MCIIISGERHRTFVRRMEVELAGDPELEKDINPYNLPEVYTYWVPIAQETLPSSFRVLLYTAGFESTPSLASPGLRIDFY